MNAIDMLGESVRTDLRATLRTDFEEHISLPTPPNNRIR
jgi:hypothetical protein